MSKKNQGFAINVEWMIIYVANETKSRTLFNLGGSTNIFEKLKSDFNQQKRVFQIKPNSNDPKDMDLWNDVFHRIHELVLSTLSLQVLQYEEDSRKLEQQRMMPGWNYCQYFIQKEALIFTYELAGLYDEALAHYDELEATFYQTMTEQGAPWFAKFGGTEPLDDSRDILNSSAKPYRDLIIQNSISIFDFRIYLFSRQCYLLIKSGLPQQVCYRAKLFISSFSHTLYEYRVSLFPMFREVWTFAACTRVIQACDDLIANTGGLFKEYEALKGELMFTARLQLDRIGHACDLLDNPFHRPSKRPLVMQVASSQDSLNGQEFKDKVTDAVIKKALDSPSTFDDLYISLTKMALKQFESAGRRATVNLLKSDLAFLHL